MPLKASKETKILTEGSTDPITGNANLTTSWKGKVVILNPEKSEIAQKMGFKVKGMYAIKVN